MILCKFKPRIKLENEVDMLYEVYIYVIPNAVSPLHCTHTGSVQRLSDAQYQLRGDELFTMITIPKGLKPK